ncbi:MAG: PqqD family protein, partial [Clostridia bacterium]|nr:PqqD family protein [Clostridia bacterium]
DTGRFLWDKLAEGCEKEELVSAILAEYDIDRATAESDIDRFTETLKGANILE